MDGRWACCAGAALGCWRCWPAAFCCWGALGAADGAGAFWLKVGAGRPKELPPPKRLAASASMLVVTMLKQIKKATRNFFMVVGHLVVEKIRRRA